MKKTILLLVILSLMVPVTALAAVSMPTKPDAIEFSLGGFIKMDTMWDSSTTNKNMVSKIFRDNDPYNQHGRFRAMATGSRFNFTIKGPKVLGATLTGFMEADWDALGATTPPANDSADTGTFRLRHAMFRLNWPETELLMGQYWSMFSEFFPEVAQDGGFHYRGANVYRPAQIRLTQKFLGAWTAAFAVATPRQLTGRDATGFEDERAEAPHLEAKLGFEQDLWGKAAYYGNPRGFVAQVAAAWQRTNVLAETDGATSSFRTMWGTNSYSAAAVAGQVPAGIKLPNHQTLDHWAVQGSMFIPVIPTYSANLAGTASLLTQWSLGQGQAFVLGTWLTDDAFLTFDRRDGTPNMIFKRVLTPSFTGFVQGQYYFTNQWFLNLCWGYMRNFGIGFDRLTPGGFYKSALVGAPANGGNNDLTKFSNQINGTLWYQPIRALKFGLAYTYTQDVYFQRTAYTQAAGATGAPTAGVFNAVGRSNNVAEDHRVQFVGFFFF